MSRKYNYNYKSSSRKNNSKLISLIIILAVIVLAIILILVNKDKLLNKVAGMLGMETTTVETTLGSNQTSSTTTKSTETSGSSETTTTVDENLMWYDKELLFARDEINIEPLENELRNYIFQFSGQYGISFIDLTSGTRFGINDIDYYEAASTIKIPLSLFIYNKVATEGLNLNEKMEYLEEDTEGGTGYIINHGKVGEEFTLRTLCKYAIIYSDNIATNMLLREFGRTELKTFMREIGGEVVDDTDNVSCPRDMALYLEKLYLFEQEYPDLGREIVSYLQKTHLAVGGYVNTPGANERLIKYLPQEILVAHKIGNVTGGWHDVGIIYAGDKPYTLAVMTYSALYDEVNDVIANISKKVYDYLEALPTY